MTKERICQKCGEKNSADDSRCQACGASLSEETRVGQEGLAPSWRRGGCRTKLLILAGLIVLGGILISWAVITHRHKASTYGITAPSSAALRIENKTSDFAIRRVSIEEARSGLVIRDEPGGLDVGARAVFEIPPGTYVVRVFYMEIEPIVMGRPEGFLNESFSVSPGGAALLSFQGGRSSPDGLIYIPPELVFK